jgi:HNH endonuclease
MNGNQTCACGCGFETNIGLNGKPRTYLRGHNGRNAGLGWMEGGYWHVMIDGKKIAFHRYLMELHLGRRLDRNEVVHHIDGNPLNNDPDNLAVLSRSEHQRLHACSSRRAWTVEETKRALALRESGMKIWEIALVLGRPFSTTAHHLAKIAKESRLVAVPA